MGTMEQRNQLPQISCRISESHSELSFRSIGIIRIIKVAIAEALVPSATVTGIGIGLGSIDIAVSAF